MVLVYGAIAAVALGVADFFGARAAKGIGPVTAAFVVQTVGSLAYLLWYVVTGTGPPVMPATAWAHAVTGALLMGAGVCTLYLAFERGPVSLASPLSAAYPLVSTAVGVLFFHAGLSLGECVAIAVIVFGIMVASGLFGVDRTERTMTAGPKFALLTTVLFGVGYPLLGAAIETAGWQVVTMIQLTVMVPVLGLMLAVRRSSERGRVRDALRSPLVIAAGLLQMLAILTINIGYGLDQAAGAMVVATSATYPIITTVLALRHFGEQVDRLALAGAGLTIVGVLALHAL